MTIYENDKYKLCISRKTGTPYGWMKTTDGKWIVFPIYNMDAFHEIRKNLGFELIGK